MQPNADPTDLPQEALYLRVASWILPALVLGVYVHIGTQGLSSVPGGVTDARFNSIVLEHLYLWATGNAPGLWSPGFFFPYPDALTFSDNHFGSGVLYVVARLAGFEREIAYTFWHFFGYLASFLAMRWTLRKFGFSPMAATIGGIVFAFSSTMLIRTEHSQLVYRFATPLAIYFGWRFLEAGRLKALGLFFVFLAWQFLCSIYIGVFLVMLLGAIGVGVLLFRHTRALLIALPQRAMRKQGLQDYLLLIVGLVGLVMLAVTMERYSTDSAMYGFTRDADYILSQLPRLDSWIRMNNSPLYDWMTARLTEDAFGHERQMFVGFTATLLIALSLLALVASPDWRPVWAIMAVTVPMVMLLTLRELPGGLTLYEPLATAPGFNAIRAPARIITVVLFPMGMLAAAGYHLVSQRLHTASPYLAGGLALVIAAGLLTETAATQVHSTARTVLAGREANLEATLPATLPPAAVLVYRERSDPSNPYIYSDIDAVVLAQDLRLSTINGYSGNFPPGYRAMRRCEDIYSPLGGGGYFNSLTSEELNAILARVVPLDFREDCQLMPGGDTGFSYADPLEMFTQDWISTALPSAIELRVLNVSEQSGQLRTQLELSNSSTTNLPGNFNAERYNLKFSWRFEPVEQSLPIGDGWNTRANVRPSTPPGGNAIQTIWVDAPEEPGRYRFQATLVQEEVMWFHDHDMRIASSNVTITVDANGAVSTSTESVPIPAPETP